MHAERSNERVYYRLIWGHHDIPPNEPIYPSIPENPMDGENDTLPRICTAPSLDECLTALGPTFIGLNLLERFKEEKPAKSTTLPFTVLKFKINQLDPNVWCCGKVARYVPDALWTQECWLMEPTVPCEIKHLWLVDGAIVKDRLPVNGSRFIYNMFSESVWCAEERPPQKELFKSIMIETKAWLKQQNSLESKMQRAAAQISKPQENHQESIEKEPCL